MNLNLSKLLKDSSFEYKDAKSINTWIRVLDTSGMSVVDQLILDNHRRQLLKSLHEDPKPSQARKISTTKGVNRSFTSNPPLQTHLQTKNSNFSFKLLNSSFITNPDPQVCAERLYSDAYYRDLKLKNLKELKDSKEIEETLDHIKARHPNRKLDPEVFNRLTHDERFIKSWYEKDGTVSGENKESSRRFSASEQKESIERLLRNRGNSCCKRSKAEENEKKLSGEELKAMIDRLYKVRPRGDAEKENGGLKSGSRPRRRMRKNKLVNELKSSKRYLEDIEKTSEFVYESLFEGSGESFRSPLRSPAEGKGEGQEEGLELRLIKLNEISPSPAQTEVNTGSPFDSDFKLTYKKIESGDEFGRKEDEGYSSIDHKLSDFEQSNEENEGFTIVVLSEENEKKEEKSLETDISNTNTSPHSDFCIKIDEFSPELNEVYRDHLNPLLPRHPELGCEPNKSINFCPKDPLNLTSSTISSQGKPENPLKNFPFPKSYYLEPEDSNIKDQLPTFSQESLYLMQNPLQSINSSSYSPKKSNPCILDSYRFIVGISENDEFIYAD